MTSDQFREWLDAHGVDGAPTVPGWYYCAGRNGIGIFLRSDRGVMAGAFIGGDGSDSLRSAGSYFDSDIARHAPLPDFAAMARELEGMRARSAKLCECTRIAYSREQFGKRRVQAAPWPSASCQLCHGSGAVWVTP